MEPVATLRYNHPSHATLHFILRDTMPSSSSPSPAERSGIQTTSSGERHIPQSLRPDGSLRKEIKIRPGYRPPEDVEVYKNRTAEAWKTRGSAGVPGADGPSDGDAGKGSAGKNAKRREARKKAKAAEVIEDGEMNGTGERRPAAAGEDTEKEGRSGETSHPGSGKGSKSQPPTQSPESQLDLDAEKEKQARNLRKRLRQARELKEKKESGESLLPEQFAKVIKIQELTRQLDALGFDSDGAKKPKDVQ